MRTVYSFEDWDGWRWGLCIPLALHQLATLHLDDVDAALAVIRAGYLWFDDDGFAERASHWWIDDASGRPLDGPVLLDLPPVVHRAALYVASPAQLIRAARLEADKFLRSGLDVRAAVEAEVDLLVGLRVVSAEVGSRDIPGRPGRRDGTAPNRWGCPTNLEGAP